MLGLVDQDYKMIENKFPGKDITEDDIREKFPLCAKKNENHLKTTPIR